jgi:beta-phosphoglucomutase-like phosphatase (HAD superfamily)
MRKAIVDVDSILFDFMTVMKTRMRIMYPHKDIPEEFDTWAHPEDYFDSFEEMIGLFTRIHLQQETFTPIVGAYELLQSLRQKGYSIHIASNRPPHTRQALVNWLNGHNLYYNTVFANEDKSVLFDDPKVDILIDDRPSTQEDGLRRGFTVMTLEYKYNSHVEGTHKFETLHGINMFLLNAVQDAI